MMVLIQGGRNPKAATDYFKEGTEEKPRDINDVEFNSGNEELFLNICKNTKTKGDKYNSFVVSFKGKDIPKEKQKAMKEEFFELFFEGIDEDERAELVGGDHNDTDNDHSHYYQAKKNLLTGGMNTFYYHKRDLKRKALIIDYINLKYGDFSENENINQLREETRLEKINNFRKLNNQDLIDFDKKSISKEQKKEINIKKNKLIHNDIKELIYDDILTSFEDVKEYITDKENGLGLEILSEKNQFSYLKDKDKNFILDEQGNKQQSDFYGGELKISDGTNTFYLKGEFYGNTRAGKWCYNNKQPERNIERKVEEYSKPRPDIASDRQPDTDTRTTSRDTEQDRSKWYFKGNGRQQRELEDIKRRLDQEQKRRREFLETRVSLSKKSDIRRNRQQRYQNRTSTIEKNVEPKFETNSKSIKQRPTFISKVSLDTNNNISIDNNNINNNIDKSIISDKLKAQNEKIINNQRETKTNGPDRSQDTLEYGKRIISREEPTNTREKQNNSRTRNINNRARKTNSRARVTVSDIRTRLSKLKSKNRELTKKLDTKINQPFHNSFDDFGYPSNFNVNRFLDLKYRAIFGKLSYEERQELIEMEKQWEEEKRRKIEENSLNLTRYNKYMNSMTERDIFDKKQALLNNIRPKEEDILDFKKTFADFSSSGNNILSDDLKTYFKVVEDSNIQFVDDRLIDKGNVINYDKNHNKVFISKDIKYKDINTVLDNVDELIDLCYQNKEKFEKQKIVSEKYREEQRQKMTNKKINITDDVEMSLKEKLGFDMTDEGVLKFDKIDFTESVKDYEKYLKESFEKLDKEIDKEAEYIKSEVLKQIKEHEQKMEQFVKEQKNTTEPSKLEALKARLKVNREELEKKLEKRNEEHIQRVEEHRRKMEESDTKQFKEKLTNTGVKVKGAIIKLNENGVTKTITKPDGSIETKSLTPFEIYSTINKSKDLKKGIKLFPELEKIYKKEHSNKINQGQNSGTNKTIKDLEITKKPTNNNNSSSNSASARK
jgi:hypothetical protein